MQKVACQSLDRLFRTQVYHKLSVDTFPSYPSFHVAGTAIKAIGQCRCGDWLIAFGRRLLISHHCSACQIIIRLIGKEAFLIQSTIFLGLVVTLIQGRYLVFGTTFLESGQQDRKSTRLNSSHANISYAVFCLKKKKTTTSLTHFTIHSL